MRNHPNALVFLCSIAALCACDPEVGTESDGGVFPSDGAAAASCDGTDDGSCPCASAVDGDTRYLFCLDVTTWEQARDKCRDFGFSLVRIDSEREQNFVWTEGTDLVGENDWWIGLTDTASEGDFLWEDGAPLGDFQPWAPMQPDQGGAEEVVEEDCIEMHSDQGGRWNDLACSIDYLDFICERRE